MLTLFFPGVGNCADFSVSPKNQVVLAGEPARLDCTPVDGSMDFFQWYYQQIAPAALIQMTSGKLIIPEYTDVITLLTTDGTNKYDLYINSTTSTEARRYACRTLSPLMTYYAELFVLGKFEVIKKTKLLIICILVFIVLQRCHFSYFCRISYFLVISL